MSRTAAIAYTTGGTVQAGGGVYVSRCADAELLQTCREGVFAYVLTARQMGKSSLMTRTAEQLRAEGVQAIVVDLQAIGVTVTAEQWYLGILVAIEEQLMLDTDVIDWWMNQSGLGITQRFTRFFDRVLLKEIESQIVILVDEIDTVLSLDFTDDFFVAIRYFQVNRAQQPEFERLSFALFGVATPSDLIRDRQRTPFNIGQRIDLTDFTPAEAHPFAEGLHLPPAIAQQVLGWVLDWTGGHPYLTQRLCQVLVTEPPTRWTQAAIAQRVAATFFNDQSQQDNNLQFVRDMVLRRSPDLSATLEIYRDIWNRNTVEDDPQSLIHAHLKLSGLVKRQGTTLTVRNAIYRQVFNRAWLRSHLPETWWDRLKPAMPLLATMLVATAGMAGITVYAWQQRTLAEQREREARYQAQVSKALRLAALVQDNRRQGHFSPTTTLVAIETLQRLHELGQPPIDGDDFLRAALPIMARSVGKPLIHRELVYQAVFSPDGRYVATASQDKTARVSEVFTGRELVQVTHRDRVRAVAFSPDGRYLATASWDKTAKVTEIATGRVVSQWQHRDSVFGVTFTPDGQFVVSGSWDKTIRITNAITGQPIRQFTLSGRINTVAVSPNSKYLAVGSTDDTARVLDLETGQEVQRIQHQDEVWSVAFSPDSRYVATGSDDKTARIHTVGTNQVVAQIPHLDWVIGVTFSPDGRYLATACRDRAARILDIKTGKEVKRIAHQSEVWGVSFSPGGTYVATASRDKTARVSDLITGLHGFPVNHTKQVNAVAFSPDAQFVVTVSDDGIGRVSETLTSRQVAQIQHQAPITAVLFSSDVRVVATASDDKTVQILDSHTGRLRHRIQHQDALNAIAISPDGRYLASGGEEHRTYITDIQTGQILAKIRQLHRVVDVAFSPDGHEVATASWDATVLISNAKTGKERLRITHPNRAVALAFSPDGQLIATADSKGVVYVSEVATGKQRYTITHGDWVKDVNFSPDGRYLATASDDGTARVSEAQTGTLVTQVVHQDQVTQVTFSRDGKYLSTASRDGTAYLSNPKTGTPLARITHQSWVNGVAFSPNSKYLATAGRDGTAQLSLIPAEDLIVAACQRISMNLSLAEWRQYFGDEPYRATCPNLPPAPDSSVPETPAEK